MSLVLGSQGLVGGVKRLVESELPDFDSQTAQYLAELFATAPLPRWEEIRWDWSGATQLGTPNEPDGRVRVLGLKLQHSKEMGDGCLKLSTFYREERSGGLPVVESVARLGRAGYKSASFYATMLGKENGTYNVLEGGFLQVILKLGPSLFRNYLGDNNPPRRIVVHTPYGERLLRLRYSTG